MFAIIAAAGQSSRMGYVKKQFLRLGEKYILEISIEKLLKCNIQNIVVATAEKDIKTATEITKKFKNYVTIVKGSNTRHKTIKNAFLNYSKKQNDSDIVLIHDAARPFFNIADTIKLIELAKKEGAAILATPATDTVKYVENFKIEKTINRSNIYLAQTPQAFKINLYKKALAMENNYVNYTDDASILEHINHKIAIVESSKINIKITTKEDLYFAKFLIENEGVDYV